MKKWEVEMQDILKRLDSATESGDRDKGKLSKTEALGFLKILSSSIDERIEQLGDELEAEAEEATEQEQDEAALAELDEELLEAADLEKGDG
jgi:hypothetical protein